jgi:hypothetical protein
MTNEEKLAKLREELWCEELCLGGAADDPSYVRNSIRKSIRSLQSQIAKIEIAMGTSHQTEPKQPKQPKITFEEWLAKREAASVTETASQERD